METLTEEVIIKIDGKKYEDYNIHNIILSQDFLRPGDLRFTMKKKEVKRDIDSCLFITPKDVMGAKLDCTIKTIRFKNDDELEKTEDKIEFSGIVFSVNIYCSSDMFSDQLIDVQAYSPDYLLIDHPHCFSYENMTLKDIVAKTLEPYSIPNEINPRTTGVIPYTVQYNETNYQFLTRLAQRYGEWLYYDGEKWIFGKIKKKDAVDLYARNDINNYNFQAGLRHHKIKHAHHDYRKYENPIKSDSDFSDLTTQGYHLLTDEAKAKSKKWFTKETFQHLRCSNPEDNDIDELEVSAKTQLFSEKTQQVVCSGSSVRSDLTIGSCIAIVDSYVEEGIYMFFEELMITGIVHRTEVNGHYSNYFTAVPSASEYPYYYQSDIYPVSAAQRAKVKENIDPEKLGRVRVQFLWQEEQDANLMTPWIRMAQPHGGAGKGFYFIPEIDEEVMVDFENGNAEKPYVVGTLYHEKQAILVGNDTNDCKIIRTRNGHTIQFQDEGDGGHIYIYDKDEENHSYMIFLSTDMKRVQLESKGDIRLYAKNDIIMEAGNNIIQRADNIFEAKSGKKSILHSDSTTIVQSQGNTDIIGGPTLVHSNSDLTMQAAGSATLEANSSITIEAGATTTIKGALVKIN